eukprot:SAG31_NODE_10905_length_1085_cov_1.277890_1_plen_70_part_10
MWPSVAIVQTHGFVPGGVGTHWPVLGFTIDPAGAAVAQLGRQPAPRWKLPLIVHGDMLQAGERSFMIAHL